MDLKRVTNINITTLRYVNKLVVGFLLLLKEQNWCG